MDLLTDEDKDSKLPQNIRSDYPSMKHHMPVEWKHSKPVRTAEF